MDGESHNQNVIARKFGVKLEQIKKVVNNLQNLGLIQIENGNILVLHENVHIDRSHAIAAINQTNWRLEAIERLRRSVSESDYSLSVCYSANPETQAQIKEILLSALTKIKNEVDRCSTPNEVYFVNIDLMGI